MCAYNKFCSSSTMNWFFPEFDLSEFVLNHFSRILMPWFKSCFIWSRRFPREYKVLSSAKLQTFKHIQLLLIFQQKWKKSLTNMGTIISLILCLVVFRGKFGPTAIRNTYFDSYLDFRKSNINVRLL